MVLLNRLESFVKDKGLFSDIQFGFREGVGCTEASFTILEAINHMIERGSNVFTCFLDVRKAFDTVWIDGLLFKLFFDFFFVICSSFCSLFTKEATATYKIILYIYVKKLFNKKQTKTHTPNRNNKKRPYPHLPTPETLTPILLTCLVI